MVKNTGSQEKILFADPKRQFIEHKEEILAAIDRVCSKGNYILGEEVAAFEQEFSAYLNCSYCVGVASGTDALTLALRAVGIKPGDEVITVSHSAVATVAAIELCGAIPVFVDIDSTTRCLNSQLLSNAFSQKTKAIIAVHIYGHPAAMPQIMAFAKTHQLKVVEDCAQAHGAEIEEKKVGAFADAAAFSFYPTKNLGALGDGGAVVTNNKATYEELLLLRQYGWKERYISEIPGQNSRLDELQAAVLRVKLPFLDVWNRRRNEIARYYSNELNKLDIILPSLPKDGRHAFHLYVIECAQRTKLQNYLAESNIICGRHYPLAIHQQPAYFQRIRGWADLRATEALYKGILSLPLYPEIADSAVCRVTESCKRFSKN